jgi:hypothetical protein
MLKARIRVLFSVLSFEQWARIRTGIRRQILQVLLSGWRDEVHNRQYRFAFQLFNCSVSICCAGSVVVTSATCACLQ